MQAEIVKIPYDREGRYPQWDREAIIVKPSSLTEENFIQSLLKDKREDEKDVVLMTQETYNKYMNECEENRKKREEEEKLQEESTESGEEKF